MIKILACCFNLSSRRSINVTRITDTPSIPLMSDLEIISQLLIFYRNVAKNKSTGLVVMGYDSCSRGCGFESRHRILVGYFSHIFVVTIIMMFV